jgi:GGDEF domain-containing protein
MQDEYLTSLEGFQDELTGLLSKQRFRSRYQTELGERKEVAIITAILFSVELDLITAALGPVAAIQIVQRLGDYVSKQLDAVGGFSARQERDQILTIIPHADHGEARQLVENFAAGLQEQALCDMQIDTRKDIGAEACFEVAVHAGVTEARSNDELEDIIGKAKSKQEIIARYTCEIEEGS